MRIAVAAVVEHQGNILIGRKIKAEHALSGQWHIPGGRLVQGESAEEAVKREILEEAGIEIDVIKLLDEKSDNASGFMVKWFLCTPVTHGLKPGSDLSAVKYIPKSEVKKHCSQKAISLWPAKVLEYLR